MNFGAYRMNPDKFRVSEDKVDQFLWRGWNGKMMAYFDYNYDYMTSGFYLNIWSACTMRDFFRT